MQYVTLITEIGLISEGPMPQTGPISAKPLRIDARTTGGLAVLEISRAAAEELVARLGMWLQAHRSR
jgi:hypothetical protein